MSERGRGWRPFGRRSGSAPAADPDEAATDPEAAVPCLPCEQQKALRPFTLNLPASELIPDDLVAEGAGVAMRGTFRGVHRGEFAGIPATGREVSAPLMIFYRLEHDRIDAHWLQFDAGAVIAQLTVVGEGVDRGPRRGVTLTAKRP